MLRFIGVMFIFTACCSAGILFSAGIKNKLDRLKLYRRMSDEIAAVIRYQNLTVRDILTALSSDKAYETLAFMNADYSDKSRPAGEIWLEKVKNDCTLSMEEKKLLSQLGAQLGTTDTEGQLSLITVFNAQLEEMIRRQSEKYAVKGRLYRSVGILAGAMFGILII